MCKENRKYLVCRKDAVHPHPSLSSSFFPVIVEMGPGDHWGEDIARKACESVFPGYIGMHEYIVVPLDEARVVEFSKRLPKPPPAEVKATVRRF